jgi:hypothetical protein
MNEMNEEEIKPLTDRLTLESQLRKRAEIRLGVPSVISRRAVQANKPDKLSDLLIEAADNIHELLAIIENLNNIVNGINHEVDDLEYILEYEKINKEY